MRLADLPIRANQEIELALKAYRENDPDIHHLREKGWLVCKSSEAGDLSGYQSYIARSHAELGIAKHAYVKGRSGWFSERSAHYLASGKPVLAQRTGFERCLPTGEGLLIFRDIDEACAGIEAINTDYERHCRAARAFAEEHLDFRKVLPRFLEAVMSDAVSDREESTGAPGP